MKWTLRVTAHWFSPLTSSVGLGAGGGVKVTEDEGLMGGTATVVAGLTVGTGHRGEGSQSLGLLIKYYLPTAEQSPFTASPSFRREGVSTPVDISVSYTHAQLLILP